MKRQYFNYLISILLFQVTLTTLSLQNYFDVLDVSPFAVPAEIEQSFENQLSISPKDEHEDIQKAYDITSKPDKRRYHMYLLLENGAQGKKPGLFADNPAVAQALFERLKKAQKDDFRQQINIIDSNAIVEKKYNQIKKEYETSLTSTGLKVEDRAKIENKLKELNESYKILTEPWILKGYSEEYKTQIEAAERQRKEELARQKKLKEEERIKKEQAAKKKQEEEKRKAEEAKKRVEEEIKKVEKEKLQKEFDLKKEKEREEYWKKFHEEHDKKMAELQDKFKHKEASITQHIVFERWPEATPTIHWVLEIKNDASFPVFIKSLKYKHSNTELLPQGSMLAIGASKSSSQKDKGYLRFADQLFKAEDIFKIVFVTKDDSGKVLDEFKVLINPNLSRRKIFITIDEKSKKENLIIRPQSGKAKGLTGKSQSGIALKNNVKKEEIKVQ